MWGGQFSPLEGKTPQKEENEVETGPGRQSRAKWGAEKKTSRPGGRTAYKNLIKFQRGKGHCKMGDRQEKDGSQGVETSLSGRVQKKEEKQEPVTDFASL